MQKILKTNKKRKIDIIVGAFLFIFSLTHEFITTGVTTSSFGRWDLFMLLLGVSLIFIGFEKLKKSKIAIITFIFVFLAMGIAEVGMLLFDWKFDILYPLQVSVAKLSVFLVNLMGIEAQTTGTSVTIFAEERNYYFSIDPRCAGIHSLTAFVLVYIIALIDIKKFNKKNAIILFLLGMVVMYLFNVFRILPIYIAAYFYGMETADFVHKWVAWLPFIILMPLLWYFMLPRLREK